MTLAKIVYRGAILALILIAAGMLLAYLHVVPPIGGFLIFVAGFLLSLLGVILGLVAIILTRTPERRAGRSQALIGTVISLAIALPIITMLVRGSKNRI